MIVTTAVTAVAIPFVSSPLKWFSTIFPGATIAVSYNSYSSVSFLSLVIVHHVYKKKSKQKTKVHEKKPERKDTQN